MAFVWFLPSLAKTHCRLATQQGTFRGWAPTMEAPSLSTGYEGQAPSRPVARVQRRECPDFVFSGWIPGRCGPVGNTEVPGVGGGGGHGQGKWKGNVL